MLSKKSFPYILISCIIIIILLFVILYEKKNKREEQQNTYKLTLNEISILQEGDLIFRQGFGLVSNLIAQKTKEKYTISHVGVVCKDTNNEWRVIHTVSNTLVDIDGIQADKLPKFIRNSKKNSIIVLRYRNGNNKTNELFVKQAKYYLNKKIPFDDHFNIDDTSEFYCTEFIRQLYIDVYQTDIYKLYTDKAYSPFGFSPFWNEDHFITVFSHQHPSEFYKKLTE